MYKKFRIEEVVQSPNCADTLYKIWGKVSVFNWTYIDSYPTRGMAEDRIRRLANYPYVNRSWFYHDDGKEDYSSSW